VKEKRRHPRVDFFAKVKWKLINDPSVSSLEKADVSRDISGGGMRMMSSQQFIAGDLLDCEIELPAKTIIHAKGKVVWVKKMESDAPQNKVSYNIGVEFFEISDDDKDDLMKLVMRLRTA
jgi:c-di-GMP-binding flagellar brake protein YcgR